METNQEEVLREIARLESENDHLATEIDSVDRLLRLTGFPKGLESLKESASEIIEDIS